MRRHCPRRVDNSTVVPASRNRLKYALALHVGNVERRRRVRGDYLVAEVTENVNGYVVSVFSAPFSSTDVLCRHANKHPTDQRAHLTQPQSSMRTRTHIIIVYLSRRRS